MKLNIVSPHASHYFGGMEAVTINMARNLAQHGAEVRFITRAAEKQTENYLKLKSDDMKGLTCVEVQTALATPMPDASWPTFYRIACDFGIAAQPYYQSLCDADLFVTHLSVDSLFVPGGIPNILHLHGSPDSVDPLMAAAIQLPRATIAHSASVAEWWVGRFPTLRPKVFLNGIDTSMFNGEVFADRPIDILYVGRFLNHKGVDDILEAAWPDCRVVLAGNGPMLDELRTIADRRGLSRIEFYDSPSTTKIRQLYRQAKIFACPSRGKEALLTTLLEAGASGCAVVTTSGSGMTDLVKDGVDAMVVNPASPADLRSVFQTLLSDSSRRIALAACLQEEIRHMWSWSSKSQDLMELYQSATLLGS